MQNFPGKIQLGIHCWPKRASCHTPPSTKGLHETGCWFTLLHSIPGRILFILFSLRKTLDFLSFFFFRPTEKNLTTNLHPPKLTWKLGKTRAKTTINEYVSSIQKMRIFWFSSLPCWFRAVFVVTHLLLFSPICSPTSFRQGHWNFIFRWFQVLKAGKSRPSQLVTSSSKSADRHHTEGAEISSLDSRWKPCWHSSILFVS